ncbi:hypothetical protein DENSPDRAFT_841057 [Dentipellis sp. KUC8613]|nr:hypothetical protein DENSPDRAFT_841057 [Dentipellis sp. KUC8613]
MNIRDCNLALSESAQLCPSTSDTTQAGGVPRWKSVLRMLLAIIYKTYALGLHILCSHGKSLSSRSSTHPLMNAVSHLLCSFGVGLPLLFVHVRLVILVHRLTILNLLMFSSSDEISIPSKHC